MPAVPFRTFPAVLCLVTASVLMLAFGAPSQSSAQVVAEPWPGGSAVATVDDAAAFSSNLSGLDYEASGAGTRGILWAVRNGPENLYRLIWNGTAWVPDPDNGWGAGKQLRYTNGAIRPDTEGLTLTTDSAAGIYVATERSNNNAGACT